MWRIMNTDFTLQCFMLCECHILSKLILSDAKKKNKNKQTKKQNKKQKPNTQLTTVTRKPSRHEAAFLLLLTCNMSYFLQYWKGNPERCIGNKWVNPNNEIGSSLTEIIDNISHW